MPRPHDTPRRGATLAAPTNWPTENPKKTNHNAPLGSCPAFVDTRFFEFSESTMAKKHPRYVPEFRRQMIELVRAGRGPEELAKEFEPSAQAIRNWVAQARP